jgi:hypothetical protein
MNKFIFIRYFDRRDSTVPVDSTSVCKFNDPQAETKLKEHLETDDILRYLQDYPGGKVDVVLL